MPKYRVLRDQGLPINAESPHRFGDVVESEDQSWEKWVEMGYAEYAGDTPGLLLIGDGVIKSGDEGEPFISREIEPGVPMPPMTEPTPQIDSDLLKKKK